MNLYESINKGFDRMYNKRSLTESLEDLLEAMSPEDEADSKVIRTVINKLQARSNAHLTPEEKAVLAKYGIKKSWYDPHDLSVLGSKEDPEGHWGRHRLSKGLMGADPDKVNYADLARKRPERTDARVLHDYVGNAYDPYGMGYGDEQSLDTADRGKEEFVMKRKMYDMDQALRDRRWNQRELDAIDKEYDDKIAEIERTREYNKKRYADTVRDKNQRINKLLRRDESLGDDIDKYQEWVDYDMKRYHRISADTMDEIKKAGLTVTKDQYGDYEVIGKDAIHEDVSNKYRVEYSYRDRNARGLHFKDGKKIVSAKSKEDAIKKIERALDDDVDVKRVVELD